MKYNTHGARLEASDMVASPTTFATIAQLESITLPSETRGSEDAPATHDDAVGGVLGKLVDALRSLGTFSVTVVEDFGDPTHDGATGLYSFMGDDAPRDYRVVLPDANATTITFSGYITGRTPQALPANRGVARTDYEITPTAAPVIA